MELFGFLKYKAKYKGKAKGFEGNATLNTKGILGFWGKYNAKYKGNAKVSWVNTKKIQRKC